MLSTHPLANHVPLAHTQSDELKDVIEFGANPGSLRMRLYVPQGLPKASALVVVLHGSCQDAHAYAAGAGWLSLADRFGFAVLCPEQNSKNNRLLAFNWFLPEDIARGTGEAHSIQQMVLHAIKEHGLAPDLVFITGLSSGGAMAVAMLASYPELFAAGAPIAGLAYGSAANFLEALSAMYVSRGRQEEEWGDKVRAASGHPGPWPAISVWHGTSDSTVTPGAAVSIIRQWTNVHGVAGGAVKKDTADGREYLVWHSSSGRSLVEMHLIAGMAHGSALNTKGVEGCGEAGKYLLEMGLSSSLEIASSWGLPETNIHTSKPLRREVNRPGFVGGSRS